MTRQLPPWVYRCATCSTWASDLPVDINGATHDDLDEELRGRGLAPLRHHNNSAILEKLRINAPSGPKTLLDVGCAHGWFVEQAAEAGFSAMGIEPDTHMAAHARSKGVNVLEGVFPAALPADRTFSVFTFNDVLEHVPDPRAAVAASY